MENPDSKVEKTDPQMTFEDFMQRICTKPNGRRITTMHVYGDSKPAKEIIAATPRWVEIGRHDSVVDR